LLKNNKRLSLRRSRKSKLNSRNRERQSLRQRLERKSKLKRRLRKRLLPKSKLKLTRLLTNSNKKSSNQYSNSMLKENKNNGFRKNLRRNLKSIGNYMTRRRPPSKRNRRPSRCSTRRKNPNKRFKN
jgi:hypothetical protein